MVDVVGAVEGAGVDDTKGWLGSAQHRVKSKPYTLHYTEKGSHPPPLETIIINLDFFLSQPQVSRPVSVARLGSFTVIRTQPKSDTGVFSPCL